MTHLSLHEFEELRREQVPRDVYAWLEARCIQQSDAPTPWLRMTRRGGLQFTNYVGVVRAPGGFHIEVLPKTGDRALVISMLRCLREFRHLHAADAQLRTANMPLWEIFIREFLDTVTNVVKHGLRSAYEQREDNLVAMRGKLLIGQHLRANLTRADRFFTLHDEFTTSRPENRLLRSALRVASSEAVSPSTQKLARELEFAFAEIPPSTSHALDFQRVQLQRGMTAYEDALAWARLLLEELTPLGTPGAHETPSLLFPMERLFEAFVAAHLGRQLPPPYRLKTQAASEFLVTHRESRWFQLRPDLLIHREQQPVMVLDTKWKLLDASKTNSSDKYGLAQSDFYQLQAYGRTYLEDTGTLVLVYPKTDDFHEPLPVFEFPKHGALKLWVVPFDLKARRLLFPDVATFTEMFRVA